MQDEIKDCGAACLLTLIKTYGGNVSMEYLRMITNTSKNGTNFLYLSQAAEIIGFETRALNGDVSKIKKTLLPCIAHVTIDSKYKHFVVIHSIGIKTLTIADPSYGIKKMKIEDFKKISTGNYLFMIPNKKIPIIKCENNLSRYVIELVSKFKKHLILIIFFSLTYTILNIISSYGFQFIIEDAIEMSSLNNLYFIFIILLLFIFFKNVFNYFRMLLFNYVTCKIDFELMKDVFRHIIFLPYQYYKNRSTSDILSRINDLVNVRNTLSNIFMTLLIDGVLVFFVLISLFSINVYLSLVAVSFSVFYLLIAKLFLPLYKKKIIINNELNSQVNSCLVESLESVNTIKGLFVEKIFVNKFCDVYKNSINKNYSFFNLINLQNLIKGFIDSLSIILIIFCGAILVIKNKMTITELITFNTLIVYFFEPIKNVISFSFDFQQFLVSLRRINELYEIDEEKIELDNKFVGINLIGNIHVDNLCYSYNGRNNILKGINIDICSGDRVLIYGDSGCGKSTLIKIFTKFYYVENGMIEIDGKDINDYSLMEIRRDICYVSQNEKLLTDSIYNNIVLHRDIDYDSFLKVCKITQVNGIVKNNLSKYNMLLEEDGFNISGGERQKIIMARSLIKKSNIYIFDESLSQIDIENERIILNNIFKLLKGKTIIFISHRFDNKDLFNKSYHLNNGVISG